MVSIPVALRTVKDDLIRLITAHGQHALEQEPWVWRDRVLPPLVVLQLFLLQILHGNTAIQHLRHLSAIPLTASAYCKARARLPLKFLERVHQSVARMFIRETHDTLRWLGHRVWRMDGSSFSMPDTPALQAHFGQHSAQKPGCGFPTATLLLLTDALGFAVKTLALPMNASEMAHAWLMHEELEAGDVLVADRGFCSYVHFALILQRNLHAIMRTHQKQRVDFRPRRKSADARPKADRRRRPTTQWLRWLGTRDQVVRWHKPKQKPRWMDADAFAALPEVIDVRQLRYDVTCKGFRTTRVTLTTTLVDVDRYSAEALAEQYDGRWRIETQLNELKTVMKMDVLKCRSVEGVLKELAVFTLLYNLVRRVMLAAAERQKVPIDRISFIDALRWLRSGRTSLEVCDLIVNPHRRGRIEPRVVKRRPKPHRLMTKPREELRKTLLGQGVGP